MKYVFQFMIIAGISLLGEFLHSIVPLPFPASIYGITILFLALEFKLIKVSDIKETSSFLIEAMPVMFLPAAAGLMNSWGVVKDSMLQYAVIILVSTFIVMAFSGWATQLVIRSGKKNGEDRK